MSCLLTRLWLFPAVLLLAGMVPLATCEETGGQRGQSRRPTDKECREKEREIERRLNLPVTVNFVDTPLREVLGKLRISQGINLWIDDQALLQEGIKPDQRVTLQAEDISFKAALTFLLHPIKLAFLIKDEVLQITTESAARGKPVTAAYPVADLVVPLTPLGQLRTSWGLLGTLSSEVTLPSPPIQTRERALIDVIMACISPRTWSELGGSGTIEYFPLTMSLVICQTQDVQERIQEFLQDLRRQQEQEVRLEVSVVSIGEEMAGKLKDKDGIDCIRLSKRVKTSGGLQVTTLSEKDRAKWLALVQSDQKTQVVLSPTLALLNGQSGCVHLPDEPATCYAIDIQMKKGRFYSEVSRPGIFLNTQAEIALDGSSVHVHLDLKTVRLQQPWNNWKVNQMLTIPNNCTAVLSGWKIEGDRKPANWVSEGSPDAYAEEDTPETRYQLVLVTPKHVVKEEEPAILETEETQLVPVAVKTSEEFLKDANQEAAAVLVKKYRQACSEGRDEEARKLGRQALKLDPACFSKTP